MYQLPIKFGMYNNINRTPGMDRERTGFRGLQVCDQSFSKNFKADIKVPKQIVFRNLIIFWKYNV